MISKLYNGEIELDFDEVGHSYYLNGEKVDGVTSTLENIAKFGLMEWAIWNDLNEAKAKILDKKNLNKDELENIFVESELAHDKVREDAATFGTMVHEWVEAFVKGKNPDLPTNEDAQRRIKEFLDWVLEKKIEFIDSERVIYSKEDRYCGTLDVTFKVGDKFYVGDIKTSNSIRSEHFFQTAAYQKALQEELGMHVDGRMIIRLGKKKFEVVETNDFEDDFAVFRAALALHRNPRLKEDKENYKKKQRSKKYYAKK